MAAADYYLCDCCGGKAFYDANLNYDYDNYDEVTGAYKLDYVGDIKVVCDSCSDKYEVIIVEKLA